MAKSSGPLSSTSRHPTSDDIRILALLDIHGFHYQQYMAPEEICLERITLSSFLINNPNTDPAFKYESPLSSLFPLSPLYSSSKLNKLGRENTHYPEIFLSVILFFLYCFFDITRFLWMRHAVVEFWVIFLKTINFWSNIFKRYTFKKSFDIGVFTTCDCCRIHS